MAVVPFLRLVASMLILVALAAPAWAGKEGPDRGGGIGRCNSRGGVGPDCTIYPRAADPAMLLAGQSAPTEVVGSVHAGLP